MKKLANILSCSITLAAAFFFSAPNAKAQNLLVNSSFENASEFFPVPPSFPSGLSVVNQGWALYGKLLNRT
jgi:hypothetical protein